MVEAEKTPWVGRPEKHERHSGFSDMRHMTLKIIEVKCKSESLAASSNPISKVSEEA